MTKELHYYLMANANGDLVKTQAKRNKTVKDLQEIIKTHFINVNFITNNIFEHEINGKKITTLLRRVVSSGNKDNLLAKRVQVTKKDVDRLVDDIISIYQFNSVTVFLRSTNPNSLNDLPDNITNLFWIKIGDIAQVIKTQESKKIEKISRRKNTKIIITVNSSDLYREMIISPEKEIEEVDFELLPIEPESDYIPVTPNNNAELTADKEVGRFGEKIIYEMLYNQNKELLSKIKKTCIENLVWQNQFRESYMPYDIIADELHVEVKSSKNDGTFMMSSNEKDLLDDRDIEYTLIKVDGIDIKKNTFKNITVYSREELQKMKFKEMKTFTVREKQKWQK